VFWHDKTPQNASGYYILRKKKSPSPATDFVRIADVPGGDSTSFLDAGVAPNTTYLYKVQAHGSAGHSDASDKTKPVVTPGRFSRVRAHQPSGPEEEKGTLIIVFSFFGLPRGRR